ncbi:MAG: tRNA glutamyl-Q(34) synthetase GluQRS [Phycisphaerae bacterium]|nr:tRNA glutamyl-Q(34) synthetase GluQRS [Phycisphaerae bacterium]
MANRLIWAVPTPDAHTHDQRTTRLAPSPTGALHLGNARTFLINWAIARNASWTIRMRIEDLDTPRVKPGAERDAIQDLEWLGLDWDDDILTQSHHLDPYRDAMSALAARRLVYPCSLTRAEIEQVASAPNEGDPHETPYPASLRPDDRPTTFDDADTNWRLVVPDRAITIDDAFLGPRVITPAQSVGDFVIWTKRAQPAYQLAVVVDDARQGVNEVVRGSDLLDSAARQTLLYDALSITDRPRYTHLPLVRGEDGRRLAKRHGDTRLSHYRDRGVPPERIIGLLARWSGLTDHREPMNAEAFRQAFSLTALPANDVTFTKEDDLWLLS